jgi:hypothetical protein
VRGEYFFKVLTAKKNKAVSVFDRLTSQI